MDDVGLAVFGQTGDVIALIAQIDFEEVVAVEMKVPENAPALPQEMPLLSQSVLESHHGYLRRLLVFDEHLRFHSIVVERSHKPV